MRFLICGAALFGSLHAWAVTTQSVWQSSMLPLSLMPMGALVCELSLADGSGKQLATVWESRMPPNTIVALATNSRPEDVADACDRAKPPGGSGHPVSPPADLDVQVARVPVDGLTTLTTSVPFRTP